MKAPAGATTVNLPEGNNPNQVSGPQLDWATASGSLGRQIILNQVLPIAFTSATGLAVQPDGKVLVAGNAGNSIIGARFNPAGTPDTNPSAYPSDP